MEQAAGLGTWQSCTLSRDTQTQTHIQRHRRQASPAHGICDIGRPVCDAPCAAPPARATPRCARHPLTPPCVPAGPRRHAYLRVSVGPRPRVREGRRKGRAKGQAQPWQGQPWQGPRSATYMPSPGPGLDAHVPLHVGYSLLTRRNALEVHVAHVAAEQRRGRRSSLRRLRG